MDFADDMDEAVDEAAAWGSAAGQQEAGIWTVEGVLAKEERALRWYQPNILRYLKRYLICHIS